MVNTYYASKLRTYVIIIYNCNDAILLTFQNTVRINSYYNDF